MKVISFNIDISQILQYAFNMFSSMQPVLYLWIGAAFGGFVLWLILKLVRGEKG